LETPFTLSFFTSALMAMRCWISPKVKVNVEGGVSGTAEAILMPCVWRFEGE
jgi:hypothetical protein